MGTGRMLKASRSRPASLLPWPQSQGAGYGAGYGAGGRLLLGKRAVREGGWALLKPGCPREQLVSLVIGVLGWQRDAERRRGASLQRFKPVFAQSGKTSKELLCRKTCFLQH